jgi:hypothetical protein
MITRSREFLGIEGKGMPAPPSFARVSVKSSHALLFSAGSRVIHPYSRFSVGTTEPALSLCCHMLARDFDPRMQSFGKGMLETFFALALKCNQ